MNTDLLLFSIFSMGALLSSFMVITLKNAVHSVLFLILVFCNISCLLLLLGAEFFAFMFLIVYVGAIAVLFLFVVMMLNIKTNSLKLNNLSSIPLGLILGFVLLNEIYKFITSIFNVSNLQILKYTSWLSENRSITNVEAIGNVLYTNYSSLFLLCGIVLLVAMIGSIVLTMHQRSMVRKQNISKQLMRNPRGSLKFLLLRR